MLDLSRQDPGHEREKVVIGPLLEEVVLLIKPQARQNGVTIENLWQEEETWVWGSGSELRQVFFNLVLNSVEAMNNRGILVLKGTVTDQSVEIRICDTGPGIPANVMEKVTQAFFTTKPEGTGLGLTVVQRILDAHNGELEMQSTAGGTIATVRLPYPATVPAP